MTVAAREVHNNADAVAARIVEATDGNIVLGLPLGLSKASRIANALYARVFADRSIRLEISTALLVVGHGTALHRTAERAAVRWL